MPSILDLQILRLPQSPPFERSKQRKFFRLHPIHAQQTFTPVRISAIPQTSSPADFLAAERTYLAWLRTGIALMGFGFVVARFGLFLREFQMEQHVAQTSHSGLSLWIGTALVAMGVAMEVAATIRHLRLVRQLEAGEPFRGRASRTAIVVAILLALTGLALAAYLVFVH